MKTIKVITPDFGIQEIKPKKVFELFNHSFAVVDMPTKYMNATEPLIMTYVIHFKTGRVLPLHGKSHRETLKSYVQKSQVNIEMVYKRIGEKDFNNQLNQLAILN